MDNPSPTVSFPRADRRPDRTVLYVLGASIQFLVGPQQDEDALCVLKRTIPPGISVPMHSHDFVEVFYVLSGNFEGGIPTGVIKTSRLRMTFITAIRRSADQEQVKKSIPKLKERH